MTSITDKRAAFRALHQSGFFIIPNAWDAGSAKRLQKLGFKAIASTSAGAAWGLGKDDGEISLDEALAHLRMLVAATDLPVNADFEAGFADEPEDVAYNVSLAMDTGIAGLSIEDWSNGAFYDRELAAQRITAARAAVDASDPTAMLVGRCEHYRDRSRPVSDTVARIVAYAEAGADILFAPGIDDHGAIAEIIAAVAPKPVNVVVHAYDDNITALAKLGVRRVSIGGSLAHIAWEAVDAAAAKLKSFEPSA